MLLGNIVNSRPKAKKLSKLTPVEFTRIAKPLYNFNVKTLTQVGL